MPRRGRSPTEKHGYNSDGESIRNSSHSRGRGSPRGTSLSLSTGNSSISGSVSRYWSESSAASSSIRGRDPSVVAESSTVVGSVAAGIVLSHDQAAWMAMTDRKQQQDQRRDDTSSPSFSENAVLGGAMNNKEADAIDGCFKV